VFQALTGKVSARPRSTTVSSDVDRGHEAGAVPRTRQCRSAGTTAMSSTPAAQIHAPSTGPTLPCRRRKKPFAPDGLKHATI